VLPTESDYRAMRIWLYDFINHKCIWRAEDPSLRLPSVNPGEFYSWQFFLRKGLLDATFREYVGHLFWKNFAHAYRTKRFQIIGPETGATPLVSALMSTAEYYEIHPNTLALRKERKKYGVLNQFEGIIDYSIPALVVDDLTNSGRTIKKANTAVASEGIELLPYSFVLIGRETTKIDEKQTIQNYSGLFSIFHLNDFVLDFSKYAEKYGTVNMKRVEFERNLRN